MNIANSRTFSFKEEIQTLEKSIQHFQVASKV